LPNLLGCSSRFAGPANSLRPRLARRSARKPQRSSRSCMSADPGLGSPLAASWSRIDDPSGPRGLHSHQRGRREDGRLGCDAVRVAARSFPVASVATGGPRRRPLAQAGGQSPRSPRERRNHARVARPERPRAVGGVRNRVREASRRPFASACRSSAYDPVALYPPT